MNPLMKQQCEDPPILASKMFCVLYLKIFDSNSVVFNVVKLLYEQNADIYSLVSSMILEVIILHN